jgi:hypothetical protein
VESEEEQLDTLQTERLKLLGMDEAIKTGSDVPQLSFFTVTEFSEI